MNLFYDPNLSPKLGEFFLNQEESLHLTKVLRFKIGQKVFLTNGKGDLFTAVIKEIQRKAVLIEVVSFSHHAPAHPGFQLAVAPLKQAKRMEWMLEKLVELGIGKLFFIQTFHTERAKWNPERVQKIMVGAMKQSLQYHLPEVAWLTFDKLMGDLPDVELKLMAHCEEASEKHFLPQLCSDFPNASKLLLIGPEGDFSDFEIQKALDLDFRMVNLGEQRLRTETAALAGLLWMNTFAQMQKA